jgi:hypothetical protein
MNTERIAAPAITTALPIALLAGGSRNRPLPSVPRNAMRTARRLAVCAQTYYALMQGAVTQAAPRTRAEVRPRMATARATRAVDIDLHD